MTTTVAPRRTFTVRDAVTTRPLTTETRTSVTPADAVPEAVPDGAPDAPPDAPPVSERACEAGFPHPAQASGATATTHITTTTGHLDARTMPPPGPARPRPPGAVHHTM
ncbi:hypothetical protein [Actinomadura oligospora]|uniref:hypothetical protein n=1 Tax=Actinomadura oligospora TaxID=111804 RepID=UPI000555A746|nr:hypothetical protein [Actinomadura oligospora]